MNAAEAARNASHRVSGVTRNNRLMLGALLVLAGAECLYWLVAGDLWYGFRTFYAQGNADIILERTRNAYLLFAWAGVNAAATVALALRRRPWSRALVSAVQLGNLAYGLWWFVPLAWSSGRIDSSDWVLLQPAAAVVVLVLLLSVADRGE